jgi:hypothetical protein
MKRKARFIIGALVCVVAVVLSTSSNANHDQAVSFPSADGQPGHVSGFVLLARHRFDPMIQRWLAEQSLKALPIRHGQLFYIIPVATNPMQEQMQIRYIEEMLNRQPVEPEAD